ncbi:hypothetical protein UT300005_27970 [Clostridium sp. CTA-5]
MATISSSIEIQDRFSSTLNNMCTLLNNATSRFNTLQNVMNKDVKFHTGSNLKSDLNSSKSNA